MLIGKKPENRVGIPRLAEMLFILILVFALPAQMLMTINPPMPSADFIVSELGSVAYDVSNNKRATAAIPDTVNAAVEVTQSSNETIIRQTGLDATLRWDSLTIPLGHTLILEQNDPAARLRLFVEGDVLIAGTLDAGYQLDIDARGAVSIGSTAQITADSSIRLASRESTLEHAGHISVPGGQISLLSKQDIRVLDGLLDASGQYGGGDVRIGGGWQGGEGLMSAERAYVGPEALITADAVTDGNGGTVVVWSDKHTVFGGSITARGGDEGGDGGRVEVSGKALEFEGNVDTRAPQGRSGSLLLDPNDIVIESGAGSADDGEIADNQVVFADGGGATFTISNTAINAQLAANDVLLQANNTITQNAGADINGANTITFQTGTDAGDHILFGADVTTANIVMIAGGDVSGSGTLQADTIDINASGDVLVNTDNGTNTPTVFRVNTSNGDIVVNHSGPMALTNAVITACSAGAQPCDIAIATHSPLTLAGNVLNMGGGDIALAAGADGFTTGGDDLATAGHNIVASGSSGTISLFAGEDVLLTGDSIVSTETTGSILISAGTNAEVVGMSTVLSTSTATEDSPEGSLNGNVFMNSEAVVRSADGDITIQAPRNLGISSVDADFGDTGAAGAVTLIADHAGITGGLGADNIGAITDTSAAETPNVKGGVISITAGSDGSDNGIGVRGAAGDFDIHAYTRLSTSTADGDQFIVTPFSITLGPLNAGTADISLTTTATATVDNLISGSALDLRAIDTFLNGGASLESTSGDIVLVSGMSFTNNAGAGVLSTPNKWLIKSSNNANTTLGGLVPDETHLADRPPNPGDFTGPRILILNDQTTVMPDSLTYTDQSVGTTSTAQMVTFSNPISRSVTPTLSLAGMHPADFDIPAATDNCDGQRVASGKTCTFQVVFEPTVTGTRTGQVSISVSNGNNLSVTLSGSGVEYDFGDAPLAAQSGFASDYPTLAGAMGAAHELGAAGPHLGASAPDADSTGQPSVDADGDDTDGTDDEDGLMEPLDDLLIGDMATIMVMTSNASATDRLSAWIDYNRDGVWDNVDERIAHDVTGLDAGTVMLTPTVPVATIPGQTFMRLRVCSTSMQCNVPTGIATDGEVEDYAVTLLPKVTLSADRNTLLEDGSDSPATLTASLNSTYPVSSGTDVTVTLGVGGTATGGGTDYTQSSGNMLTIPAGSSNASLTITAEQDVIDEGAGETIVVDITGVTDAAENGSQQEIIDLADDDGPPILSISDVSEDESNGPLIFTVTKGGQTSQTVMVNIATTDGSAVSPDDFAAINPAQTLSFAPGEQMKTVNITLVNDDLYELDESFTATLSNPVNATIDTGTATGTITNDEALPVVTLSLSGSPMQENSGMATVTAMLSGLSTLDVTIDLNLGGTATSGNDYMASATQIMIPAGDMTGSITLVSIDDGLFDGDESVAVGINSITNAAENGSQRVVATISEDDSLPVVTIASAPGAATTARVGQSNVVMLAVDVTVPTYPEALQVTSLDLTAGGSGQDHIDISSVKLWQDNGDGSFSTADTQLASGTYNTDNGTLTLTRNVSLASGQTHRLFVTYDYSTSLAALALPMMAGLPLLIGFGLIGLGGRRSRTLLLCLLIAIAPITLTGCPGTVEAVAVYAATQDDDDDDSTVAQTESFRVSPTAVTAAFVSGAVPTVTGLPIAGNTVTVSE